MRTTRLIACAYALVAVSLIVTSCRSLGGSSAPWTVSADKELTRPEGYRKWVFVGEPVTPNDMNGGKAPFPEFHSVYMDPESFAHYERTGEFRDGTILVKELVSVGSKKAVSGKGYFMGDFIGLEATVKSKEHFPNEPGNWAYFSFSNPGGALKAKAKAFPTASCNDCHEKHAKEDFVFTQYYPVLRAAKGRGETSLTRRPFTMSANGKLQRPRGYRKWVFVGEPVTPNDMNGGKAPFPEFHNVYIDPASFEHYERTGEFRDGTILVKELVSVGSKKAVSGKGYFMGDFIGLEATIKSKKHFPDEPGNWAYFSFTSSGGSYKAEAEAFPTNACNDCHAGNAAQDFVFTQYYPVLRAANGESTANTPASMGQWDPTASTPDGPMGGVPLAKPDLFQYLKSGRYKRFPAQEANSHPGRGPHTAIGLPVRVFYNDILNRSLAAKSSKHPTGAAAIKEMFDENGRLNGWAVMVKTQSSSQDGKGWFWYEVTSATDSSKLAAVGNGVPGCASCHSAGGSDFVLSGYPLR